MSMREAAVAALFAAVDAALPAAIVLRDETAPEKVPAAGLVVVSTGEMRQAEPIMSPLSYAVEHEAEVRIFVAGNDAAARATALDTALLAVNAAITANRTLGGTVEWAQPGAPAFEQEEAEGARPVASASLPISLFFTALASPAG